MPEMPAMNGMYEIVQWFWIYSILGWCIETLYMSFCAKKFVNRGFILGPVCPIYGFGAVGAYLLFRPFSYSFPLLYVMGSIGATFFEFLVAKLMQQMFGAVWWDYHDKPFNYKGILCLESTLAWGLYTVCLFGFLHGAVSRFAASYPVSIGMMFASIMSLYYAVDFMIHLYQAKERELPRSVRILPETVRSIGENIRNFYR